MSALNVRQATAADLEGLAAMLERIVASPHFDIIVATKADQLTHARRSPAR